MDELKKWLIADCGILRFLIVGAVSPAPGNEIQSILPGDTAIKQIEEIADC